MRAAFKVALATLAVTLPLAAHHSFTAEFDIKKVAILQGTVIKMEWVNPHAYIHIAVKNSNGTVTEWAVEGNTPNSLLRVGLNKKSLLPGTELAVKGYLAKSGENVISGSSIIFKSGKKMSLGSEGGDAADRSAVLEWISSDEDIWRVQIAELKLNNSH
jgi:hypothetical protein